MTPPRKYADDAGPGREAGARARRRCRTRPRPPSAPPPSAPAPRPRPRARRRGCRAPPSSSASRASRASAAQASAGELRTVISSSASRAQMPTAGASRASAVERLEGRHDPRLGDRVEPAARARRGRRRAPAARPAGSSARGGLPHGLELPGRPREHDHQRAPSCSTTAAGRRPGRRQHLRAGGQGGLLLAGRAARPGRGPRCAGCAGLDHARAPRGSSRTARPVAAATASIVRSSWVGPRPPVVQTRSTPSASMPPRGPASARRGRRPRSRPARRRRRAASSERASTPALRSWIRPRSTSSPVTRMAARSAAAAGSVDDLGPRRGRSGSSPRPWRRARPACRRRSPASSPGLAARIQMPLRDLEDLGLAGGEDALEDHARPSRRGRAPGPRSRCSPMPVSTIGDLLGPHRAPPGRPCRARPRAPGRRGGRGAAAGAGGIGAGGRRADAEPDQQRDGHHAADRPARAAAARCGGAARRWRAAATGPGAAAAGGARCRCRG